MDVSFARQSPRRAFLRAAVACGVGSVTGCGRDAAPAEEGGWIGASVERGHRLREFTANSKSGALPATAVQRRARVLIVGAGIAGLAAARALQRAGVDDVHLLELEDQPGGNSRGHTMAGRRCPLGAHYLPLPGPHAHEVAELLQELQLAHSAHGRVVYDERHLCHSPQERLFIDGTWVDGLLPPAQDRSPTMAQYRRFAQAVRRVQRELAFAIPTARAPWTAGHAMLDGVTFAHWLAGEGLDDARLRWYLDYCCRDDYGAGANTVSAWAGLHYFASRHGFDVPGDDRADDHQDAVLTWPEGNAWLGQRLAAPHRERTHTARTVLRVSEGRHDVMVLAWDEATSQVEAWTAGQVVLAVPLWIAARLLQSPPPALLQAAAQMHHAPWLVANLQLDEPLVDRVPGAAPSWDNVVYGSAALGYVDAMHQSTRPVAGATVLTAYRALAETERARLLQADWRVWAQATLDDLATAHPDLARKVKRFDLMRYGHAMSMPVPGVRGSAALRALALARGRIRFAHADLSAYSVFEEALYQGQAAVQGIA